MHFDRNVWVWPSEKFAGESQAILIRNECRKEADPISSDSEIEKMVIIGKSF